MNLKYHWIWHIDHDVYLCQTRHSCRIKLLFSPWFDQILGDIEFSHAAIETYEASVLYHKWHVLYSSFLSVLDSWITQYRREYTFYDVYLLPPLSFQIKHLTFDIHHLKSNCCRSLYSTVHLQKAMNHKQLDCDFKAIIANIGNKYGRFFL